MDKTMDVKLKYIPNDDTQSYPFYSEKLLLGSFEQSTEWKI